MPYWVTYKDVVNYAGATCVFVDTDEAEGFQLHASMVERALTPKTKMIIINSPSNPSGRGVCADGAGTDCADRARSRHLGDDGRMLSPLPVRRRAVFDGCVSRT